MSIGKFEVKPKQKCILVFKVGVLWIFKYFFDDKEMFKALLDYYNEDNYRVEFKTVGERNNALKLLERNGFDYEFVETLQNYLVKLPKSARYAQILKNSVAHKETANERIFLMKDQAAIEEALSLGAQIVEDGIAKGDLEAVNCLIDHASIELILQSLRCLSRIIEEIVI